jgi:hypothetical protein
MGAKLLRFDTPQRDLNSNQKTFDLRRTPTRLFLIGRRAGRDSAITYEFSARAACGEIRMAFRDELALNGGLMALPEIV